MASEIDETEIDTLIDTYPFLSAISYREEWFVGIIQNIENQFVWFYDLQKLKTPDEKRRFLEYGSEWHSFSNMEIPIEMFIGDRFEEFQHSLRGFARKQVEDIRGHQVNLSETFERRIKKKKIDLVIIEESE
jgi:hypothetical protein